jgi:broad specificity polyphosphatase/5'/3'-nucleotidase SurE
MVENYKEGTDGFELLNKNCISLTPLKWDMTGNIESLKNW